MSMPREADERTGAVLTYGSLRIEFSLGEMIRKAREEKGWNQTRFAERVHMSQSAVAAWENNTNRPSHATICYIADITGKPIEFFPDEQGMPLSRCTENSPAQRTVIDLSRFRHRHSPSSKP